MNQKIAFVTPFYLPACLSGSGVVVNQLAEGLRQKGHDCSVVTSDGLNTRWWYDPLFGQRVKKKFEMINGVKVYRLSCRQFLSLPALILVRYFKFFLPQTIYNKLKLFYCGPYLVGLSKLLNKEKFDVIYSSPIPAYLNKQVGEAVQKLLPKPKLIIGSYFHASLLDYHNPELKKIFDTADLIHVATNSEKKDIQKIFKITDNKFFCLPHFLNLTKMKNIIDIKTEVKNFKNKFKLKDKKIILFAAGKIYEKGAFTLLNTMNNLYKKDFAYRLITIGNNTPSWNKYKRRLHSDFLMDLGFVSEKQKEIIFAACDIFCMPSIAESFGLTYLEAWHKKKPVIGANISVVKELIQNADGGALVEFADEKALEETIKKLVENRALNKRLGNNGFKAVMKNYTFSTVYSEYCSLLGKKGGV